MYLKNYDLGVISVVLSIFYSLGTWQSWFVASLGISEIMKLKVTRPKLTSSSYRPVSILFSPRVAVLDFHSTLWSSREKENVMLDANYSTTLACKLWRLFTLSPPLYVTEWSVVFLPLPTMQPSCLCFFRRHGQIKAHCFWWLWKKIHVFTFKDPYLKGLCIDMPHITSTLMRESNTFKK